MILRRTALGCLIALAGAAAQGQPLAGHAFVAPDAAEALRRAPRGEAAAAVLRVATAALARPPRPMARVHVEGTLPHQGIYDASAEALRDLPAARDLALAGRLSGEARFTAAAARICGAWAATYQPSFNPIDETGFDALMIAWDLLPEPARAPHAVAMAQLLHGFAEGYPRQTPRGTTAINNWNSHRVKLATLASFATGDARLIAQARARYLTQLRDNIGPDGIVYDFGQRDALHYVVYSLEPLLTAAMAGRRHGEAWWSDAEFRLGTAIAWLRPYAAGEKRHMEFVNSRVEFDRTRRAAGLPGFAGPYDPKKARTVMAMAARFDPALRPLAQRLRDAAWQDAWLDVLWPLS